MDKPPDSQDMRWYDYEKQGWSWSIGWSPTRNGYYAQMWRDLPSKLRPNNGFRRLENGRLMFRECFTESGKSILEAKLKLWTRIDSLENTGGNDEN